LLLSRVIEAVNHHGDDLPSAAVAYEIELLKAMLEVRDDLWQLRLKAGENTNIRGLGMTYHENQA